MVSAVGVLLDDVYGVRRATVVVLVYPEVFRRGVPQVAAMVGFRNEVTLEGAPPDLSGGALFVVGEMSGRTWPSQVLGEG